MSRLSTTSKLGLFFGFLAIFILAGSCTRDNGDVVPYVHLDLSLGINTDLASLGVGEEATIRPDQNGAGVIRFNDPRLLDVQLGFGQILNGNGLIVYRKDIYRYEVYDITCTFKASTDYCALEPKEGFAYVFDCPCCNSSFLYNSDAYYVVKPPASMPLRRYNAFVDGGYLIIRN
jgi:hypothetical protein